MGDSNPDSNPRWESHQRNDRTDKTCQHSAMKHSRQTRRAPQTHPSASAVPSYHRILVKHDLIEKTLSISDAYEVFLKVSADPEVEKLRRKVELGNRMKHVPALHLATAMALQSMTRQELEALKLRIESCQNIERTGLEASRAAKNALDSVNR